MIYPSKCATPMITKRTFIQVVTDIVELRDQCYRFGEAIRPFMFFPDGDGFMMFYSESPMQSTVWALTEAFEDSEDEIYDLIVRSSTERISECQKEAASLYDALVADRMRDSDDLGGGHNVELFDYE